MNPTTTASVPSANQNPQLTRLQRLAAFDASDERSLSTAANSRNDWYITFLVTQIVRYTASSPSEICNLRFSDVTLTPGRNHLILAANAHRRARFIPLNAIARAAIVDCMNEAKACGAHLPEHFIFPKRLAHGVCDPSMPASASALRRSFNELRDAAGLPWLTQSIMRHLEILRFVATI